CHQGVAHYTTKFGLAWLGRRPAAYPRQTGAVRSGRHQSGRNRRRHGTTNPIRIQRLRGALPRRQDSGDLARRGGEEASDPAATVESSESGAATAGSIELAQTERGACVLRRSRPEPDATCFSISGVSLLGYVHFCQIDLVPREGP